MINEQFLNLNFGGEIIILRIISVNLQRDRIEFGLEQHQIDGCILLALVLSRVGEKYMSALKYINHEQRICYGRFKEFTHEFS